MTDSQKVFVRHVHTDEIREVTAEQREVLDKNYWVRITGPDVQVTPPASAPSTPSAPASTADVDPTPAPKTASKATTPAK
ncbi:hypothetical protein E9228_002768 [Curtobacterium flaccumfaciens]|uniref:Uncharacterized protein n=1 Tax=Curtobacterium salicis TaxID=1779862 RepID=A0ABX0TE99_9MICO|nr:hypothetical protein [Curtobacterium sp. WW7]NII42110.1 hypothetical protein [Curtobacterium sp. WW7]